MATVVQVENISKAYQLGQFNTGTLANDLKRWWALRRGKEDPFLLVGEENDRTKASESNIVWSLKDVSFNIQEGDCLGIIGRNGAGKSTLLKILSQITSPTSGTVKIKGRIASLLEVGTGFHPELSGRENIFLNGAILGMRSAEIKSKFDEIVEFSGVERYLDTPVKRYSSGMYVRLAFAVAAHLESEVLIVDEVLAVGDADFQKKCLGKMKDISHSQGRTVLFVSHNLSAIRTFCTKGVLLERGRLVNEGEIDQVIEHYISSGNKAIDGLIPQNYPRLYYHQKSAFTSITLSTSTGEVSDRFYYRDLIRVKVQFSVFAKLENTIAIIMVSSLDTSLIVYQDSTSSYSTNLDFDPGEYIMITDLNAKLLPGNYSISLSLARAEDGLTLEWVDRVYDFNVGKVSRSNKELDYKWNSSFGSVLNESPMEIQKV